MPELPEVETTARMLAQRVSGRRITDAWMDPLKPINTGSNLSWPKIRRAVIGSKITTVSRRAKYVVIRFAGGSSLWVHQKMTGHLLAGHWIIRGKTWVNQDKGALAEDPANRFIRVVLSLEDGSHIALSDARRFARVIFVPSEDKTGMIKELARIGPEPFEISSTDFRKLWQSRKGMVKAALTDPSFIAGVGNIYADEILHRTGIHPFALLGSVPAATVDDVYRTMRSVLRSAIRAGGSSTDDYRTPDGTIGGYQRKHLVYGRQGRSCSLCRKGVIIRVMRNGRSSHFCENHQKNSA